MLTGLGKQAEPLIAAYARPGESRNIAVARMWGENAMAMPARRRARQQAERGQRVWLYRFGYVPQALSKVLPGVGHADEIQFVFGVPSPAARAGWSGADQAMAKRVGDYWVAFARTGNPNHAGAPRWPAFTVKGQEGIQFGADSIATLDTASAKRLDALETACCGTP